MSSHHFVREGQEPALFILNATDFAHAEGLLEWAPLVLVAEQALDDVLLWGIKVDVVLASAMDTEQLASRLMDQVPVKILSSGQNYADTALRYLSTIRHHAVSILADGLEDELRATVESMPYQLQVNVITADSKWSFIHSGTFKKWYQAQSRIGFSHPALADQLKGLKPVPSGFEVTDDQWISVHSTGSFWVQEFL